MSNFMIVRGFPGSGKSTYVMREYTGLMFFETDMFNIVDGQYVWSVDRSREAIRLISEFTTSIFNSPNRPDFALCGVFGTFKNIIKHICNAKDHGYEIYIKTLKTQFECVHNVPKEAIQRFHKTFMEDDEIKKEKCITLAFVGDERICDGYYYATSFKLLSKYLKKPELLEEHAVVKSDIK